MNKVLFPSKRPMTHESSNQRYISIASGLLFSSANNKADTATGMWSVRKENNWDFCFNQIHCLQKGGKSCFSAIEEGERAGRRGDHCGFPFSVTALSVGTAHTPITPLLSLSNGTWRQSTRITQYCPNALFSGTRQKKQEKRR